MNTLGPMELNDQAVHFCGCILDCETQILQTKTDFIRLRSKLWNVLYELISSPNKLVSRDLLIQHIWRGNCYTGEQGLTHAICHLRRILKKYQVKARIITLPKKGYILQYLENEMLPLNNVSSFEIPRKPMSMNHDNDNFQQRFKYPISY